MLDYALLMFSRLAPSCRHDQLSSLMSINFTKASSSGTVESIDSTPGLKQFSRWYFGFFLSFFLLWLYSSEHEKTTDISPPGLVEPKKAYCSFDPTNNTEHAQSQWPEKNTPVELPMSLGIRATLSLLVQTIDN